MTRVRPVDAGRLALGLIAVGRPDALLALAGPTQHITPMRRAVRILGGRYLVQSGAGLLDRRPWLPEVDGLIDLTHAASMIAAATLWPQHRHLALLSAATATGFAALDLTEQVRNNYARQRARWMSRSNDHPR